MPNTEDWWVSEYAVEIYEHLRAKEEDRPVFRAQSPQLHMRHYLITWLSLVCEKLGFCVTVQHLSAYFLDYFMDNHSIYHSQLQLVTLGCVLVAAKLEEKDSLIPKNSEVNKLVGETFELHEFVQVELAILDFFQWELFTPTVADFIGYFTLGAITDTDLHAGRPLQSHSHVSIYVQQYIRYFLEVSLKDYVFLKFPASLVAASCIYCTRLCLFLTPTWPLALQKLTYYSSDQLLGCMQLMIRYLEDDEKAAKPKQDTEDKDRNTSSPTDSQSSSSSCVELDP